MNIPEGIIKNEPLAPKTTLGVGGKAQYFVKVLTTEDLKVVCKWAHTHNIPVTILGSGSNVFIDDAGVQGLVIQPAFQGLSYEDNDAYTYVTAGAGLILDELIQNLLDMGITGLENLSSIPSTIGAVPIQNVGAYGVEAKDFVHQVHVFDIESCEEGVLSNQECQFGYRDSIFKHDAGKNKIVTQVVFQLPKISPPNISYTDLQEYFKADNNPTAQEVRQAVIEIRSRKLPDWKSIGTAGSFFKNPIISKDQFSELRETYPEMPGYDIDDERVKIPLGWVFDKVCGLKGFSKGDVGLYEKQALVLVCKKGMPTNEIDDFLALVKNKVFEKTGIQIEEEVKKLG